MSQPRWNSAFLSVQLSLALAILSLALHGETRPPEFGRAEHGLQIRAWLTDVSPSQVLHVEWRNAGREPLRMVFGSGTIDRPCYTLEIMVTPEGGKPQQVFPRCQFEPVAGYLGWFIQILQPAQVQTLELPVAEVFGVSPPRPQSLAALLQAGARIQVRFRSDGKSGEGSWQDTTGWSGEVAARDISVRARTH